MEQIITLTENDIRNMVLEAVIGLESQYEINEGKWGQRLGAAAIGTMLAGGAIGGSHIGNDFDLTWDDMRLNTPRIEAPESNYSPDVYDINGDGSISYDERVASGPISRFKKGQQQQTQKEPVSRLQKQNVQHKNRDFEASSDLINYIKTYETFHDGWIDDGAGYLTTGWGFKQTPELKKKWPNGLHQTKDKNGNLSCPEADAYLLHYIDSTTDDFISKTPNIKMLPQRVKDALYDLYYNIGPNKYADADNLQKSLAAYPKTKDLQNIVNNMRYAKSNGKVMKGLQYRSTDRQDMALHGDYNREEYRTLRGLQKARNIK